MSTKTKPTITLTKELELLGSINEQLIAMRDELASIGIAPLRLHELKAVMASTQRLAQEHYLACEILATAPLADSFPDGTPAPTTFTYRQALYLAALASPGMQSREQIGLPPSRPCRELTKDGYKCSASSLLFSKRAVCGSHATPAERERNRKAKERWNREHPDYQI